MALPLLNDKPKYSVNIPSLGTRVNFRPYLVKEEKVLLLAMESKDPQQILQSISDTVIACITDPVDASKLTTFDIEFLFLKIRAKSVGERAPLLIKCDKCDHQNEHVLEIDDVNITVDGERSKKIALSPEISVKMKWPTYSDMVTESAMHGKNQTEITFSMVIKCIDSIMTEDEHFLMKDHTREDALAFVDSMTSEQYKLITDFIESIPRLKHKIEFECESCCKPVEYELNGINDFF